MTLLHRHDRSPFIIIVGPDGCGKSTVVRSLSQEMNSETLYWRPGLLPMARLLLKREAPSGVNSDPHGRSPDSTVKGVLRSLYYAIDYVLGSRFVVRRAVRGGKSVIADRWIQDMWVDPHRYGLKGTKILRVAAKFCYPADLLVVLHAEPSAIAARSAELPAAEILRQYEEWKNLRSGASAVAWVNNEREPQAAVGEILRLVDTSTSEGSTSAFGSR